MTSAAVRHPALVAVAMAAFLIACASSTSPAQSPTTTLDDPRHGHSVPIACGAIATEDCRRIAGDMLRYFSEDTAKVEGIRMEPLADAPADALLAARVTVDHEMAFTSGEQAYRVIQRTAGGDLSIEIILDED
jgi:hypothetical protein